MVCMAIVNAMEKTVLVNVNHDGVDDDSGKKGGYGENDDVMKLHDKDDDESWDFLIQKITGFPCCSNNCGS